jgi:hypothetical protein
MQSGATAALVSLGFLLRPLDALVLSRGAPLADVYGMDASGKPMDEDHHRDQTVELLRFVTAYGTGIETLVDLTPYSPLLEAGRASDKGLSMYSFIDTWVNNDTGTDAMYMHNITEQCYPIARSYGNGWSLSAELVFWPRGNSSSGRETASVRPKHSVTLSSGFYGGDYDFGRVAVHTAKLASHGGSVLLERAVDFEGAEHAQVYECRQGMPEMEYAARMGFLAQQVEVSVRKDGNTTAAEKLMNQTYQNMAMDEFVVSGTATTDPDGDHGNRSLVLEYNPDEAELEVGMPVYFRPGDVFTDQEMQTGVWWNLSYPFKRVGKIDALTNTTASVFLESGCIPTNKTKLGSVVPRLMSPRSKKALPELRAILRTVGNYAVERANMAPPSDPLAAAGISEVQLLLPYREDANHSAKEATPSNFLFSLGHDEDDHIAGFSVQAPKMIGTVPLLRAGNTAEAPIEAEEGANETVGGVCVLEQRRQGRLFERSFHLDDLARGEDVVVLQLTVTGHGWASTTEQCGEYCHALYQLRFNGKLAHNISEFRNDCKENPVGVNTTQIGTWWESRNGWCPGSVEPGVFVDVTKWLRKGKNHLAVDALVWSEVTKSYELYTDLSGFAFRDAASLAIGLNLFVYGADAVAAARAKEKPSTPAESALKDGVGGRGQLDPTGPPVTEEGVVQLMQKRPTSELLQMTSVVDVQTKTDQLRAGRMRGSGAAGAASREGQTRPQPPWYFLNSSVPEQVKASQIEDEGAVRIPVMVTELIQGARRVAYAQLEAALIPKDWDSVAVHFKLEKPPGNLSIDHWDRVGSFGLKLPAKQAPEGIGLHTERQPLEREKWAVTGIKQS